jgi:hypothetical protein
MLNQAQCVRMLLVASLFPFLRVYGVLAGVQGRGASDAAVCGG